MTQATAALSLLLDKCGVDAAEPKRRLVRALCVADDARYTPEQAAQSVMQVVQEELREAHALRDLRVFNGLLAFARHQYQTFFVGDGRPSDGLWRLSADCVLAFMKSHVNSLWTSQALLEYALAVGLHLEVQGEVGEHLFSKFFQACEAAGADGMGVAEAQFGRMASLHLPIKQITLGRLMAVCRAAGDGEAAKRVHGYLHRHHVQFNSHSLTQYIGTFLKLEDAAYVSQLLLACEDPSSGMSHKLNRESYQRLLDVRTSRACQELLRQHMQRMGVISAAPSAWSDPGGATADAVPAGLHAWSEGPQQGWP
jgi:hypothetical protein